MSEQRRERSRRSADEVAAYLDAALVNSPLDVAVPTEASGALSHADFAGRTRLYRQAVVLISLELAQHYRPYFQNVIGPFERFIFPLEPTVPTGVWHTTPTGVFSVLSAMRDLERLFGASTHEGKRQWAHQWFTALHVDITDAADLTRHAQSWLAFWTRTNASRASIDLTADTDG
jgi:hypothetical protein